MISVDSTTKHSCGRLIQNVGGRVLLRTVRGSPVYMIAETINRYGRIIDDKGGGSGNDSKGLNCIDGSRHKEHICNSY